MSVRDELAELPLWVQTFLKAFGLGASLGAVVAVLNIIGYLRSPTPGEALEVGALWTLVIGFPLSLALAPFLMFAPWAWMVLLPGLNLAILASFPVAIYSAIDRIRSAGK